MQKTVAVIGGGIGGLSACYHLTKSSQVFKIVLLESSSRLGGWLHSTRREDGAVFEHGPRGIRPAGNVGKNTLKMVSELGLENEILPVTSDNIASKNRFLYVGGKLHKMPSGAARALVSSVARELLVKRGTQEDESVHGFVERRLGKELADFAIDSLCRGVYAGDCRKLSVRSCFPPLFRAERDYGSIVLGMAFGRTEKVAELESKLAQKSREEGWAQWSLRQGMQALPEALEDWLRRTGRVEILQEVEVQRLERTAGGSAWEIKLHDGSIKADHIISAMPAKALSSVLPPGASPLSEELRRITSVTVAVVNLEYEGLILPVEGFGHLVPSSESRGVLGIVYDSVAFPQHNRKDGQSTRLTVMMGGAWFSEVFGDPEEVREELLLQTAAQAVRTHLGVDAEPIWSNVSLQKDCIPQYTVGHWERIDKIRQYLGQHSLPLSLVGSSYQGVSVNDVIFSSKRAVERLLGNEQTHLDTLRCGRGLFTPSK
ncbi:protoporphyrinogen oxidase-like isoform X2 [Acipenser ruthenus]|uniref:protoporphyrinogen oxidase-like isoform X2 n=1 Tax=Acipenser ruthenus TaxID=7906 RepID=UPI002740E8EF|nr:protoporphyrinogen oxidase-like isoform X2 [Acipenser ruthenus]